ncbi:glutathione S-transferase N-terminal domain-containing protein, partial [Phenylobacterium sp.]|uniref:glutathione S-transferase N-terminal domain-containing protein n=1 Tax=Phenylobacterium sp. TaxID=1871053 RepID=UPI00199569E5
MSNLVFFTNPMSRGRIVRWMLEEIGQPYDTHVLRWETGETKSPDYLAINPMGKVPTIVHDGVVVTECAAICAYLADAFPQAGLAPPANSPLRGPYYLAINPMGKVPTIVHDGVVVTNCAAICAY